MSRRYVHRPKTHPGHMPRVSSGHGGDGQARLAGAVSMGNIDIISQCCWMAKSLD